MLALTLLKIGILVLIGMLLGYVLLTLVGTFIPVNRTFDPQNKSIQLYLSTNGMHTDFILPIRNHLFDWSKFVDKNHFDIPLDTMSFLGIGWGDKSIYLDIATWGELTFKLGWNTLVLPTPSLLHLTAYQELPFDSLKISQTQISESQYLQLCHYILSYFSTDAQQKLRFIKGANANYTPNHSFFHALGKYHAFYTCNTWINKGLKRIGVRTPLWTPLDKGLFYQFNKVAI